MLMADFEDVKLKDPVLSVEDKRALKTMQEIVSIVNGKYRVGIAWKVDPEEALQNNRSMVESRLRMQYREFNSNKQLAEDYTKTSSPTSWMVTQSWSRKRMVTDQHQWFLPHHAVFKRSNPNKCRFVFHCAAQYKGISLNDAKLQGPNYLNNLAGVLLRFRKEAVAFVGVAKCMFHQCYVLPQDTRFLHFLWWPNGNTSQKARVYAMKVHLFRWNVQPKRSQLLHADNQKYSKMAIDTLRRNSCMDDIIQHCRTGKEAGAIDGVTTQSWRMWACKVYIFGREVIQSIPEGKRVKLLQNLDLNDSSLPQESAIGLKWKRNYFTYSVEVQDKTLTKRALLATTANLYDPLRLVAPVLLVPKFFQQELCWKELEWDDPLPNHKLLEFLKWRSKTPELSKLQIQRCFQESPGLSCERELHVFSDASEFAYGVVVYLKVMSEFY